MHLNGKPHNFTAKRARLHDTSFHLFSSKSNSCICQCCGPCPLIFELIVLLLPTVFQPRASAPCLQCKCESKRTQERNGERKHTTNICHQAIKVFNWTLKHLSQNIWFNNISWLIALPQNLKLKDFSCILSVYSCHFMLVS